jgi:drug/metabolite transporter (DMT)-like permease
MNHLIQLRQLFSLVLRQVQPATAERRPDRSRHWPVGLRTLVGAAFVGAFVALTWVRAESLALMMPGPVNLGLGVLTGLLGNSLGYWVGVLGLAPVRAFLVSQCLKLAQIVGVPTGYLLLGGHMLLLPVLGALLALAGVAWAYRRGLSCAHQPSA